MLDGEVGPSDAFLITQDDECRPNQMLLAEVQVKLRGSERPFAILETNAALAFGKSLARLDALGATVEDEGVALTFFHDINSIAHGRLSEDL